MVGISNKVSSKQPKTLSYALTTFNCCYPRVCDQIQNKYCYSFILIFFNVSTNAYGMDRKAKFGGGLLKVSPAP